MKKTFICILTTILIITLVCLLLSSCENSYDDQVYDFYQDDCNEEFNAIEINLGFDNNAVYYINEHYGVWSNVNGTYLFNFDYVPRSQRGGQLMIKIVTEQSYYESMVQQNDGLASFYNGKTVFSGSCEFSDNGTIATISPDKIYINEMFIAPEHTLVMTKTSIPNDDIISFDVALDDMSFVSDAYINYTSNRIGWQFSCELANLWVDGSTMTGEWNTNGSIIPIRMDLHEKVPYVEIYDISESSEKLILKSYATIVDESSIELVAPEGIVFYTTPTSPVIITKTK